MKSQILDYSQACQNRTIAETQDDPMLFERAAADFEALKMPAAAQRCRDRAMHYRKIDVVEFRQAIRIIEPVMFA